MAEGNILGRAKHAWNAFFDQKDPATNPLIEGGSDSGYGGRRPDRARMYLGGEQSIAASVYTRMAIDVSVVTVQHVKVDENSRYIETIKSGLNDCLTMTANIDQTGAAFLRDAAMSMFSEGVIAIVPVETTRDPTNSESWDINTLRVGTIKTWYPRAVRVDLYNERTGKHEEITLPKSMVAIVENPFYNIMNEPNSTLKRLIRKLNLLDVVDEQSSSGKLDLIIQLPYLIRSQARKEQAEKRRKDIEDQLRGSEYGIAYTDGTEKIIQLNRPTENNLMAQIEFLTSMLYSQLGITTGVMDGTADEATMINYYKRTIEPVVAAITDSMTRTFISKTARTQGQRVVMFNDPFKLVPVSALAELADKLTRNEILSSNEFRAVMGFKPSKEPNADALVNKNLPSAAQPAALPPASDPNQAELSGLDILARVSN